MICLTWDNKSRTGKKVGSKLVEESEQAEKHSAMTILEEGCINSRQRWRNACICMTK